MGVQPGRSAREFPHELFSEVRHCLPASTEREVGSAFEVIVRERIAALLVGADPFLDTNRDKIIALAARHAVPAIYQFAGWRAMG